jgi:type II secretory pathway component GspD/PulD (secretin)
MRSRLITFLGVAGLATASFAADQTENALLPCPDPGTGKQPCTVSKRDQKKAGEAFARGLKLQKARQMDRAFTEFEAAANLNPRAVDYLTARELTRQQLVYEHLERGNTDLLNGRQVEALAEFRGAAQLDPHNEFAQQRLRDALGEWAPKTPAAPQVLADAGEVRVVPQDGRHDFHYRGDSRGLLTQVANSFGVVVAIDDSVAQRPVRFNVEDVDFYAAMRIACQLTRSFWTPVDEKQVLVASDTPENHRQFDRMVLRTFYIPSTAPQEVTEMANVIRTVFDIRFLTPELQASALTIRAPQPTLDAITKFIETVSELRPEVMLDVHVYQISHTLVRNLGLHIPNQFQMFNIPASALTLLGGQSIQDLINQLIAGGGINQANSQSLSALLAQLQSQQNSIFSQPLATFGGGLTLFGLSLGTASAQLSLNESTAQTLEHATLRASQGKEASFRVGVRYPILNASFAPIFNTPQISQVIQNNSFQAAFPSFSYEDIGVTLKAKPSVTGNRDVGLDLQLEVRSLTGQSLNGVPVISNRGYKGSIVVKDGEPAVVAGSVSRTEQRSLNGIPGMGAVPGLNKVMTTNSKEEDEDELLVVITPHVISHPGMDQGTEIWVKAK